MSWNADILHREISSIFESEPALRFKIWFAEKKTNIYDSIIVESPSFSTGIVEFKDDAEVVTNSVDDHVSLDNELIDHVIDELTIKNFLSRPVILVKGKFQSTDTVSTAIFNIGDWPMTILNLVPMWKEKLKGYYGFRATLVLRLVANPNPFQQGRYMLSHVPTCGSAVNTDTWVNAHISTLTQRSQLPHVEFDLQCDTEAILKVPFVSAYNFFPLNTGVFLDHVLNSIRIFPYEPFSTGTGTNFCTWTLYSHMEDIELIGAAIPQSGKSEFEQVRGKIGPIGLGLRKAKAVAQALSPVPLLSSYIAPVSWAIDIASNVASVFGWSKPMIVSPHKRVVRDIVPFLGNVDGADCSKSLGYYSNNHIEQIRGFSGTDLDEMDFSHFLSIFTYVSTVTWSDSSIQSALLFGKALNPSLMFLVGPSIGSALTTINHSPVSFLSKYFNLYRGSFKFRFKLIKTKFHSGRIEICYNPWDIDGNEAPNVAENPWVMKHIVDIRTTTDFIVEFPFVNKNNYLNTASPYGTMAVYVIEGLTAPSTCSNSIKIIVEVACCPDFEFAHPFPSSQIPIFGVAPQSGCMNFEDSIGSSKCDYTMKHARASIGESIRSLRQLLRFNSRLNVTKFDITTPPPPTNVKSFSILPYGIQVLTPYNATAYKVPSVSADMYTTLASMFGLSRGGCKLKLIAPGTSQNRIITTATPCNNITQYYNLVDNDIAVGPGVATIDGTASYPWTTSMPQQVFLMSAQGVEVLCPAYTKGHSRSNADHCLATVGNTTVVNYWKSYATDVQVNIMSDTTNVNQSLDGFEIYRSGSDDSTLGCFVSIPPMTSSLLLA